MVPEPVNFWVIPEHLSCQREFVGQQIVDLVRGAVKLVQHTSKN